ncbi:MAG: multiheme c-type cytochrome [Nitrospirota bacterium]|nr:multiheme c-type cytochrome [Nitrospirota bacterium]
MKRQQASVRAIGATLALMLIGAIVHLGFAKEAAQTKGAMEKVFPSSDKCKRCHERAFEEWEASPLSRSIHSAAFRASLHEFLTQTGDKDRAMCFRCHAPHVNEYLDQVPMFIAQAQSGDPAIDGVGCAQCHLINQVDRSGAQPMPRFKLGKTLFGPYNDYVDNLAHESLALELFRKSDLCLNCHLAVPTAGDLGKSNDLLGNWETSEAAKAGKECQTCHMPEQFGESANGERRRRVANHSFPGRVGKLRQEAAKLTLDTVVKGEQSVVTVTVTSLVPHNLPTTHPGWARVLLELVIKGKNLKVVYTEQRVYGRVYGNAKGEKTVFDFEATKVLKDTVLKPEETRKEVFRFPTPKDAPSFDVEVSLHYAPVTGPSDFLLRIEAESSRGARDPVFRRIPIAKQAVNIPLR